MKTIKKILIHFIENNFLTFCVLLFFLSVYPLAIFAEEQSQFAEMARERQYPGGSEESDLKVQQKAAASSKIKLTDHQESDEGF